MKATGVIRRIDELGRIVIPKEIRKNLRLKNGENVEIYIDDQENIILKRYSCLKKFNEISKIIIEAINQVTNKSITITDVSEIICSSKKENITGKELSEEYIELINGTVKVEENNTILKITNDIIAKNYYVSPIILNGDLLGSIIIYFDKKIESVDKTLINLGLKILLKYIEE